MAPRIKRILVDWGVDKRLQEDIYPDIDPYLGPDILENDLSDFDKENLYPRHPSGTWVLLVFVREGYVLVVDDLLITTEPS